MFEQARVAWLADIMDDRFPSFVVARQELDYRRELLVSDGPARVIVQPVQVTTSTVRVHEQLLSADGSLRTESQAVLVRWNRERRCSMPFPAVERQRIQAQLSAPVETI